MVSAISRTIRDLRLLNYEVVRNNLQSEDFLIQKRSLNALLYDKQFYNKEDTIELQKFIELIENTFKERGVRSMKKQLLSSKEKEVWICECGKQNDLESLCSGCQKDIYGFKSNETKPGDVIERLEYKIELINECLN